MAEAHALKEALSVADKARLERCRLQIEQTGSRLRPALDRSLAFFAKNLA